MPAILDRCVANLTGRFGESRAFAICTAQLQKAGKLKKGTQKLARPKGGSKTVLTGKGAK